MHNEKLRGRFLRNRILGLLAALVAVLCVLAAFATGAAWLLLDALIGVSFLDKITVVNALLTCGSVLLVLCICAFAAYVIRRRAARTDVG